MTRAGDPLMLLTILCSSSSPRSQNPWDHSGTDWGKSDFVSSETNKAATRQVIKWVVNELKDVENVVGIELLNESIEPNDLLAEWCECRELF